MNKKKAKTVPIKNEKKYCPGGKFIKAAGEGEGECNSIELEKEKENVTASELDRSLLESELRIEESERRIEELTRIVDAKEKLLIQRCKELYDKMEVDTRQTHSRYIGLRPIYGSWDLHVDAAYNAVLDSLASARNHIDCLGGFPSCAVNAALEIWHQAMNRTLDRLDSTCRNGE